MIVGMFLINTEKIECKQDYNIKYAGGWFEDLSYFNERPYNIVEVIILGFFVVDCIIKFSFSNTSSKNHSNNVK